MGALMTEKQQQTLGALTGLGVSLVFGVAAAFVIGHGAFMIAAVPLGMMVGGLAAAAYGGVSVFSSDPNTEFAVGLFWGGVTAMLAGLVLLGVPLIKPLITLKPA